MNWLFFVLISLVALLTRIDGRQQCEYGFFGQHCQHKDPCALSTNRCQNGGTCVPQLSSNSTNSPSFICQCPIGFSAPLCEMTVASICDHHPCYNGGTCKLTDSLQSFRCDCATGFSGRQCEHIDHCLKKPCKNNATCVTTRDTFSCTCRQGYQGAACTEDIDECRHGIGHTKNGELSAACVHGLCINTLGSYRCQCENGWSGERCDRRFVPCSPNPCQNSGRCHVLRKSSHMITDPKSMYRCDCASGFTGEHCEINVDDCEQHICENNGTCIDGINGYTCQCNAHFTGQYCSNDIDECVLRPTVCKNGATCINTLGGYTCTCVNGWTGVDCSENIDDCRGLPCQAGGRCIDLVGTFRCECPVGRTGLFCHIDDACISNPCRPGSVCYSSPIDGTYQCTCPPGFTGADCQDDINECADTRSPCEHGGNCVNTPGSYKCDCVAGFAGPRCEINVNECESSPCRNGGTCLDERGHYKCVCMPGFTGEQCETDIDECSSNPCLNGGLCSDLINGFRCDCPKGFGGKICETNANDCANSPCLNGGSCFDSIDSFRCQCSTGFTGQFCEKSINHCLSNPCSNGRCIDRIDHYSCLCDPGFTGNHCQQPIDNCASKPCHYGGHCINNISKPEGFECVCRNGTRGHRCELTSQCWRHPCLNGATCHDNFFQYKCECQSGFTGTNCEIDINECLSNPCANGGTCHDQINGFKCTCSSGYYGRRCQSDYDECESNPCVNGATCESGVNRFICHCPPGFTGVSCETEINECLSNPCQNGGTCNDGHADYRCSCILGYSGKNCEIDVDDCRVSSVNTSRSPCQNGGKCVDLINDYRCVCAPNFTGRNCEVEQRDPCGNVQATCLNNGQCLTIGDNYRCLCRHGFTGHNCEHDVNECHTNPCRNGATCVNTYGSYQCHCSRGYEGRDCLINIDECSSSPCMNGGSCLDSVNGYRCTCLRGFTGDRCEQSINCQQNPCHLSCDPPRDCLLGLPFNPWSNCTRTHHCSAAFANGRCEPECNTRGCLFDGYDCKSHEADPTNMKRACNEFYDYTCLRRYNDGICDQACNTAECGWDGLDCEQDDRESDHARGTLYITLNRPVTVLQRDPGQVAAILIELSHLTGTTLKLMNKHNGQPDIRPVVGSEGNQWSQLSLMANNRKCVQDCFTDSGAIASFLAAFESKTQQLSQKSGLRLIDSSSRPSGSDVIEKEQPSHVTLFVAGIIFAVLAAIALATVVQSNRRKLVRTVTWFPDGFHFSSSGARSSGSVRSASTYRAPVGEYERHSLSRSLKGPGRGDTQEMRNLMMMKQSTTSIPSSADTKIETIYEEPIDPRSWSAQHYEAYGEIAARTILTPPLNAGKRENSADIIGPGGMTPLMVASAFRATSAAVSCPIDNPDETLDSVNNNAAIIQDLLNQGANLDRQAEKTGETSLHLAARYARADAAKRLLDSGADCNAQDSTGRSPLHTAIAADARGVFELLIRNRATNINAGTNDGTTPLILAARLSCHGMLGDLIQAEASIDEKDDAGKTALHWAAAVNNVDAIRLLLINGANKDSQDNLDETPLFLASREGSPQAVRVLLENHANRDITDHMDQLPRDVALARMHTDIVKLLDSFMPTNQALQPSAQQPPPLPLPTSRVNIKPDISKEAPIKKPPPSAAQSSTNTLTNKRKRKLTTNPDEPKSSLQCSPPTKIQMTHPTHNLIIQPVQATSAPQSSANTSSVSNGVTTAGQSQLSNNQFIYSTPNTVKKQFNHQPPPTPPRPQEPKAQPTQPQHTQAPSAHSQQIQPTQVQQNQSHLTPLPLNTNQAHQSQIYVNHETQNSHSQIQGQSNQAHQAQQNPQQAQGHQQPAKQNPQQVQTAQTHQQHVNVTQNHPQPMHNLQQTPVKQSLKPLKPQNSVNIANSHYEYICSTDSEQQLYSQPIKPNTAANATTVLQGSTIGVTSPQPQHQIMMMSPPLSYTANHSPAGALLSPNTPTLMSPPPHQTIYADVVKSQPVKVNNNGQYSIQQHQMLQHNQTNNTTVNHWTPNPNHQQVVYSNINQAKSTYTTGNDACYLTPSPESPETWANTMSPPSANDWNDVSYYSQPTPPAQLSQANANADPSQNNQPVKSIQPRFNVVYL